MKKRKNRTIFVDVETEAEVDIEEYVDEIIKEATDEELIKEIKSRGYQVSGERTNKFQLLCKYDNKRFFCDLLELPYFVSNDELIEEIKKNI